MTDTNMTIDQDNDSAGAWLMVIICALLFFGALIVFSAGAGLKQSLDIREFWKYGTLRRVAFVPIALIAMCIVSRINCRKLYNPKHFWLSPIVFLLVLAVIMLVLVYVPGIGYSKNGSYRWINLIPKYGIGFQPSELAKWTLGIFLAAWAAYRGNELRQFRRGFLPAFIIILLVAGQIGREDFGTAALVGAMGVIVLFIGGIRLWHLLSLIPPAMCAFYFLIYKSPYRWKRVMAFLNDNKEYEDANYQAQQALMALGSGGRSGCGLGKGVIKQGHLPEDTTDFIFAIVGEELGFVGCCLIVSLYMALMICSIVVISRTKDLFGKLICIAVAGTIGSQAVMNLMVVTSLAPNKGIALPFISAGGTGLVVTAIATGVLINIANNPDGDLAGISKPSI